MYARDEGLTAACHAAGLASCIEDRDKAVRDAALNTMVQVQYLGPNTVYKISQDVRLP
jgi:hypothetical protein